MVATRDRTSVFAGWPFLAYAHEVHARLMDDLLELERRIVRSYVTRKEVRFAKAGAVILELTPGARSWPNAKWAKKASNQLKKRLGQPLSDNIVVLHDPWWNWRPEEVAAWINDSINDPASCVRWGGSEPSLSDDVALH